MINVCYDKLSKEFKNGIETAVGQALFLKLSIKLGKMMFLSITQLIILIFSSSLDNLL